MTTNKRISVLVAAVVATGCAHGPEPDPDNATQQPSPPGTRIDTVRLTMAKTPYDCVVVQHDNDQGVSVSVWCIPAPPDYLP